MKYQKQMSKVAARIMAFVLSGVVLFAAFVFFAPMAFAFGPIILVAICVTFVVATVRYVFTRKLVLGDGIEGLLAGWALAVVFAFLILPCARGFARLYGYLAGDATSLPDMPEKWLSVSASVALLALVTLVLCIVAFVKQFVATPEECYMQGRDELDEKGPATGSIAFCMGAMMLVLFVVAPTTTIVAAAHLRLYAAEWRTCDGLEAAKERYKALGLDKKGSDRPICPKHVSYEYGASRPRSKCAGGWFRARATQVLFCLACFPAVLLGFGALRRGLWMLSIKRMVENVATSTVRGAAMGLVELHGKARPIDGAGEQAILECRYDPMAPLRTKVDPFYLEDETGRVLVDVPEDCVPGADQRVALLRHAREEGELREYRLMPGDDVYVIGNLTTDERDGQRVDIVRPWALPYGRFLLGFTNAIFNRRWGIMGMIDLNAFLGFGFLPHIFLVCDGDEKAAEAAMFRGWRRQVLWGAVMLLSAVGLLMYLDLVLPT